LVFWGGAVLVGAVASLLALASQYTDHIFHMLVATHSWITFILTPLGLMLIVALTLMLAPEARGSGIPQVLIVLNTPNDDHSKGLLSRLVILAKPLLTAAGLLCGASIGREGPTVQMGAAIMYQLGKLARVPGQYLDHSLVLCGGAAGIAAAFNAPLAGILFAIEELSRSLHERTSGILLVGVVLSGVTALAILGDYSYFGITKATLSVIQDWPAIGVFGIIGGMLGGLFSRLLILASRRLPSYAKIHPVWFAGICGLLLALIGLASGDKTYGSGYEHARALVLGTEHTGLTFPFLKLLATLVSYISGIPGGIFAPSLTIGAGLGSALSLFMPWIPSPALVLLGMVAYFSGVVQAPVTAAVIVLEMTGNNQQMLLPLMATSFVAYAVSQQVCRQPIYRALAKQFVRARDTSTTKATQGSIDPTERAADAAASLQD
jgi:H+/Cl- antiporter ClcA